MSDDPRPAPGWPAGITADGADFTIDAEVAAPRLGLTPEQLRAELRQGRVRSVVERGEGTDAGRTRLTLFYRARSWSITLKEGVR